ncbi:TetR family transcriptional regulator [Pseudoalteromonas luteoviolacea]|uniref:TetR family transcriptional regulator n=1 Tax=Pseudoalteromonas luteoviolacea TaxID=43657 RepID=A0A1C0TTM1_9GAMM|nr:TetR/AcrR family transcriptional regulator [Pseudoalteromonas luteoviolacea]MBQ4811180.1 TetR/AcrR family transcriptional regulator [Pseudoalteromonas luteoviolacea]OCQ22666.1 TetR family transcriptional regulator [Pseudoalteromonas luteoviolacea]
MKLSEKKRLQIIQAAEQLFSENGAQQTSMDLVAQTAEVSKRTVYNHFDSKEALLYAVIENMLTHVEQGNTLVYTPDECIRSQLLDIAKAEAQLLTSDTFLRIARVAFLELLQNPDMAAHLNNTKVGCMRYLEAFLVAANSAGAVNVEDVTFAAKQFVFQLKSFIFYPRLYGFALEPHMTQEFVINQTVDTFLARYQTS